MGEMGVAGCESRIRPPDPEEQHGTAKGAALIFRLRRFCRVVEGERHRAFDHHVAVHPPDSLQQPHSTSQPEDGRFNLHHLTGENRAAVPHPLDAREHDEALAIFRFGKNQDGAHLGHCFCQDGPIGIASRNTAAFQLPIMYWN